MVLMYGSKTAGSFAITEILESYREQDAVLEISPDDYHKLTGYSQFISADERMRILNLTFTELLLRDIDQLVYWITNECLRKEFDENLAVATEGGVSDTAPAGEDITAFDLEGDDIAVGILDEDNFGNHNDLRVYLEATTSTTTGPVPAESGSGPSQDEDPESLANLYYPLYGEEAREQEQEREEGTSGSKENSFVIFLGFLGSVYQTKKFCRSLSGIGYVAKTCILLDIIKRARLCHVSLREAEDVSIVEAGLYRLLTLARTHYIHLGLSLARS
ncbi:uncharacterized protein AC631_05904 [Debaryomyces fabryi]|uniref:Uncharacterized protein n=1 Tax=Debaryomyces fabryi TaxID=58627 RepID=A0A0V1PQ17_9ASCO|nr:uncharacterized protein AC631_05904 [Debaryomyces fabryi]KRZ98336.1 hypothetical protein AC631_05904 [Debaryomyces fabryi]